ncbi:MAG: 2Fe-2S iron-sulfur cluster-binding protein, partial [Planctomycetota bacterium]
MPRLRVDGREVEVPAGATVLDAARAAGASVPTMCFLKGLEPSASCMVCSVRDAASGRTLPACSARAAEGMELVTDDPGIRDFRRTAVELLLDEHAGDCEGPCRRACPAHMDIALMIRQIAAGRLDEAAAAVRRDIPFASILGRICPAPCEKACRRGLHDAPVSICLLKRFLADRELAAGG